MKGNNQAQRAGQPNLRDPRAQQKDTLQQSLPPYSVTHKKEKGASPKPKCFFRRKRLRYTMPQNLLNPMGSRNIPNFSPECQIGHKGGAWSIG